MGVSTKLVVSIDRKVGKRNLGLYYDEGRVEQITVGCRSYVDIHPLVGTARRAMRLYRVYNCMDYLD
jgi:hypothetical protein